MAHEPPAPLGEAILVPKDSPIRTVADLKGKKVALNKGSNVHYLLVRALERPASPTGTITPVFLPPADARAAFERGAVDAWAIWDPFQAAAEAATGARTLADGIGLVANHQFYLAETGLRRAHPKAVDAVIAALAEIDAWAKDNTDAVAAELSPSVGIPAPILTVALKRQTYGVKPLDAARRRRAAAHRRHVPQARAPAEAGGDLRGDPGRRELGATIFGAPGFGIARGQGASATTGRRPSTAVHRHSGAGPGAAAWGLAGLFHAGIEDVGESSNGRLHCSSARTVKASAYRGAGARAVQMSTFQIARGQLRSPTSSRSLKEQSS